MSTPDDRLLDHSYDGIQEYDNPLPSWWKWVFLASILYSVVYLMYFEIGMGTSIYEDFESAKAAYFNEKAKKYEGIEPSELSIEWLSLQPDEMNAMEGMFRGKCATCHGADASGLTGPNLTDNHWLHGGSRMEIYATIRDGVRGKAMQPWLEKLGPIDVWRMAAYVHSLRGQMRPGLAASNAAKLVEPESIAVEIPEGYLSHLTEPKRADGE